MLTAVARMNPIGRPKCRTRHARLCIEAQRLSPDRIYLGRLSRKGGSGHDIHDSTPEIRIAAETLSSALLSCCRRLLPIAIEVGLPEEPLQC
jgi:hypothetical protein